ncbi:kinase-like domain-containing protein, partial [Staphylotrichum tortipilum]
MEGGPFSQAGRPVAASDLVLSMTVSIASFTDFQRFVSDNRRRLRPGGSRGNLPEPGSRSRATTEEVPHCIAALTFLDPPAQSRASFVIGRDPNRCDIVCANPPVGNEHFQLGFVGDHLVLSDVSVRGSKIYLDGCGLHRTWPTPETPYRCFLPPGCEAVLNIPGYEFKFTVRAREGAELDEFRRKRAAFLATTSPIGRLILASQTTTQAPSASLSPLPDPGNKLKYMYWFESDLGRGGQGVVHQVRRLQDWEPFAAKHVLERSRQRTSKSDKEFESESQRLKQEMSTLQALEHKHIVKYVDWYNDGNDRWHLIMELCPLGSLQAMIGNATVVFSRRMIAEMLQQVAGGLHYLHGKGVAHRDLKPGNILVRSLNPLSLALCDFGLAKQSVRDDGAMTTHCGTRPFMAPEMWTAGRYTREVDIWALGIVGAMLLRIAFPRLSPNAPHSQYPKLIRERVITMRNADRDDEVVALVARMLAWDPRDRPSAKECLEDATEILKALRRPQPAAPRSGAAPSLATLPPPPPPPLSMSSGSGTPFRSSEVRAMERELQFSTLRRPGFVAASQKRDTTALPRSNSMEAPAPKQVR